MDSLFLIIGYLLGISSGVILNKGILSKSDFKCLQILSSLGNSLKMQQKNRPYKRIQQVGEKNVHFKIVQGNFPEKRA